MLNIEVEILPREMGSCIQMFCAVTHCLHCFIVLVLVKELDASYILSTHTLPLSCTAVSLYAHFSVIPTLSPMGQFFILEKIWQPELFATL